MKTSLLLSSVLLMAGAALADVNYNMAIDQAKRVANNPGPSVPAQHPPGSTSQHPPVNPQLAATMKNIADLRADIEALVKAEDAAAADNQKIPLLNHLSAAAQGTRPTTDSVKNLADDLITIVTRKPIALNQQEIMARNLHALFNAAHLKDAQQTTLLNAMTKILSKAGASTEETDKLATDLKAIIAETK